MPGRPHEGDGRILRRRQHVAHGVDGRPRRRPGHVVRLGAGAGVGVEPHGMAGRVADGRDVGVVVHERQDRVVGRRRLDQRVPRLRPRAGDAAQRLGPFGTLGMSRRREVVGEDVAAEQNHAGSLGARACRQARSASCRRNSRTCRASARSALGRHGERFADGHHDAREGLGDLRAVPAAECPVPGGFGVERHDRLPGGLRQPHHPGLHHPGRAARAVHGEGGGRLTRRPHELPQGARAAARARTSRRAVAEARDDARNPLAVEVLADDHDHAALAPEPHARQDAAVPGGQDEGRAAAGAGGQAFGADHLDAPGRAERAQQRRAQPRDERHLGPLAPRAAPGRRGRIIGGGGGAGHMPSYCGPSPPSGATHVMT